jgi:homoserine/homoserine lactone efflux protein
MDFNTWLLYLVTEFFLTLTPGPAVMLVWAQGLKYGSRPSWMGTLGISSANLIYFVLSALGLGAIIMAAGDLFTYIRIAGAVYLVFTGARMILDSLKFKVPPVAQINAVTDLRRAYLQGFITQIANPKAIIFFVALLPQFIDQQRNITLQFTILASTTIIMETFILMFYGWFAAHGKRWLGKHNLVNRWQDRIAGSILIGLGINLLFMKIQK